MEVRIELALILTDLVLLVFEDGDLEELRILDADPAEGQVALEDLLTTGLLSSEDICNRELPDMMSAKFWIF